MARTEVGIRELKNQLSRYVARARRGEDIVVTERGAPVARLVAVRRGNDPLAALIAEGIVEPPQRRRSRRPQQHRVRLRGRGPSMAAYVARQRR
jgi:prevent-host-death family protein